MKKSKSTKQSKKKTVVKVKKAAPKKVMVKNTPKNTTGITPVGDRVLVRRAEPEMTTASGIIIPDSTREKSEEGIIVAVGAGKKNLEGKLIPVSLEVGQRVRFSYGDEIKVGGVEYVLVHEENVSAVISK